MASWAPSRFLPTQQGFDYYYGIPYSNDMNYQGDWQELLEYSNDPNYLAEYAMYDVPLMENVQIIERPADQNTITYRYTQKAVDFIRENTEKPFFIYLAHSLPHIPLFAHPDRVGSSNQGLYGDVIEEIDWSVGMILNTLREQGLQNNTLVVFSSDNGPWLAFKTHGGSAGPLRAGKGTTFEGGQRVPTLFWGPGMVKPGTIHEMGSTLDLINTIASITGTQVPADRKMDGYDLSPVLKGETKESPRSDIIYYSNTGKLFAARKGKWKLHLQQAEPIFYGTPTEPLEVPELYNLEADISEKYEVSAANKEVVDALQELIHEHKSDLTDIMEDNLAAIIEEEQ